MSSIINKIKEAATGHTTNPAPAPEGTYGHHSTRVANAADPRIDSDADHRQNAVGTGHDDYTTSDNYGVAGTTGVTAALTGAPGQAPNTAGPHKSDMLNRLDPTVDSDLDNSRTIGGNAKAGHNVPEGTYGPHNSKIANAADPLVDSDADRTMGLGNTGPAAGYGTGIGSATHGTAAEGTYGHHSSRLANTLDPRIDSDADGSKTVGQSTGVAEGTYGPHGSRLANTLDPTVDSDRDRHAKSNKNYSTAEGVVGHVGAAIAGPHGTGPAPHTAGPHKSDILNKLDPRVDSDLDGSRTFPSNKTFSQS